MNANRDDLRAVTTEVAVADRFNSDVPYTTPDLTNSRKLKYATIEVTWARDYAGMLSKSGAAGSALRNPANNGTYPQVEDNLRIQDAGITPAMQDAGGTVKYYLGHPTEAVNDNLAIRNNHAGTIESRVVASTRYPVSLNVMELVAGGTATSLALTSGTAKPEGSN